MGIHVRLILRAGLATLRVFRTTITMLDVQKQAVCGVVPPQLGEAIIREAFPSIQARPGVATAGRMCIQSYILAPVGWFLMLPFYFLKVLPGLAIRYTLTNQRLMIRRGMLAQASQQVALADIDDVRLTSDDNSAFFRAANLEIISKGQVAMTMHGVPEADGFRVAIFNAIRAWIPGKATPIFVPAKAPDGK